MGGLPPTRLRGRRRRLRLPDPELGHRDERKVSVGDLLREPGERIRYVYDFGDHWQHDIVVEKLLATDPGRRYPVCLTGNITLGQLANLADALGRGLDISFPEVEAQYRE